MSSEGKCQSIGIALCQPIVTRHKPTNLATAERLIRQAVAEHRPRLVTLPEFFNAPYVPDEMHANAESVPDGPTCRLLGQLAAELAIYIVGGSIPELTADGRIYNTTTVWSPAGQLVTVYRKLHMIDVESPDITFTESAIIMAGDQLGVFEVDGRKFGLAICYDTNFAELAAIYRSKGADVILYNSAFPPSAGVLWWELLLRARAADNQLFVCGTSGAYVDDSDQYKYYGDSMIVDAWGRVMKRAGKEEGVIFAEMDFKWMEGIRGELQVYKHKRTDLYEIISKFK